MAAVPEMKNVREELSVSDLTVSGLSAVKMCTISSVRKVSVHEVLHGIRTKWPDLAKPNPKQKVFKDVAMNELTLFTRAVWAVS